MGIENLLLGFHIAITPFNLFMAVVGILLGTIIGVLPGLGGANGVAILLPVTFTMPPTSAIILLTSIYWGALFGGAITSILFNIPGEPWSVATTFDGYPMARQGQGGQALTGAFTSSFIGAFSPSCSLLFSPRSWPRSLSGSARRKSLQFNFLLSPVSSASAAATRSNRWYRFLSGLFSRPSGSTSSPANCG